jgi:hypothetical protein
VLRVSRAAPAGADLVGRRHCSEFNTCEWDLKPTHPRLAEQCSSWGRTPNENGQDNENREQQNQSDQRGEKVE